jgi:hypothetical protein
MPEAVIEELEPLPGLYCRPPSATVVFAINIWGKRARVADAPSTTFSPATRPATANCVVERSVPGPLYDQAWLPMPWAR